MDASKREKEYASEIEHLRVQLSALEKEKFDLTSKVSNLQEEVQKRVG
ncbi:MAG: hypothetical protein IM572_03625 [Chitinophagaceae bacterium]|nr:hypothetical protein [Chitinophagaceae bacterium]